MMLAPRFDFATPRHQKLLFEIGFPGLDITGSAFSFQARLNKEAEPAFLDLAKGGGENGISAQLIQVDGSPYTVVKIQASKAMMEAAPAAAPIGSDLAAWYGFKVDGAEYLAGAFTVAANANHV